MRSVRPQLKKPDKSADKRTPQIRFPGARGEEMRLPGIGGKKNKQFL